jgi:4'-phosphopantetheinyl transferase
LNEFTLAEYHIDIWSCNADRLKDQQDRFFALLDTHEQERALRFKFDVHRKQFIVFHGFMREVLARYLSMSPQAVCFKKGDKGKPYLHDKLKPASGLQFNLSHTRNMALLAVTRDHEIGVDIEHIDRKTDWTGIAKRFFTKPEQSALFKLPESLRQQAFYKLWTRKEAYMKVMGTGLSLAPTEFTLTVPPLEPGLVEHHSRTIASLPNVCFSELPLVSLEQGFVATVAMAGNITSVKQHQFS